MLDAPSLRWLLRLLGSDEFLPTYLGEANWDTQRTEIRLSLWAAPTDSEHPACAREVCWPVVESLLATNVDLPSFYHAVLLRVRGELDRPRHKNELRELCSAVRSLAYPEVTQQSETPRPRDPVSPGYHEIHAHFRGSIPFEHIWRSFMEDARMRARLRAEFCNVLGWKTTRGELLALAATARGSLGFADDESTDESTIRKRCIEHLDPGERQSESRSAALRYLAIMANTRRFLIHQRGKVGLVEFTRSYDVVSRCSKAASKGPSGRRADRDAVVAILNRFEDSGAVSVELRPTLDRSRADTQRRLRTIALGYFDYLLASDSPVALGLVCSLFKQEGTTDPREGIPHGSSSDRGYIERLTAQQAWWCTQTQGLLNILEDVPVLRLLVVGIDAAGREMGTPVRAFAPIYAMFRAYHAKWNLPLPTRGQGIHVAALQFGCHVHGVDKLWDKLNNGLPGLPRIRRARLGFTMHAGEDFVDPITGLREVWEAVEFLKLERGDRLGHALAASLRPKSLRAWFTNRGRTDGGGTVRLVPGPGERRWQIWKPAGTHVLDLAWETSLTSSVGPEHGAQLALAMAQALGATPTPEFIHSTLNGARYPVGVPLPGVSFLDPKTVDPHHQVWVDVDQRWLNRFEELRKRVARLLIDKGIVVESCPSSNRAVAGLENAPILDFLEEDGLRCGIATDDAGVLDSWPEDELREIEPEHHCRVLTENARSSFVWATNTWNGRHRCERLACDKS